MLIAQISDCHVLAGEQRLFGSMDTHACLKRAVRAIQALPARPGLVLATGDLTDGGRAEEYAAFLDAVSDLPCPILPLVGNHDERQALIEAFRLESQVTLLEGFVQYAWTTAGVRILALDTVTPGQAGPGWCAARMAWLSGQLANADCPVIVAMHHPPFATGIGWLDGPPDWAEELYREIVRCPRVVRVVCGHAHRAMVTGWAGTCAIIAPSTAHQTFPDLRPNSGKQFTSESPGLVLHQMVAETVRSSFVSFDGLLQKL